MSLLFQDTFSPLIFIENMDPSKQNEFSSWANSGSCAWSSLVLVLLMNVVHEFSQTPWLQREGARMQQGKAVGVT